MRRGPGLAMIVAAVALVMAAAGCSTGPKVGDGVLGLDWAALPEPVVPTPPTAVCTAGLAGYVGWSLPWEKATQVECSAEHDSETFHVGTFSAASSADGAVPELGDDLYRDAYAACAKEADAFLGGDYRTGRVFLIPVLPTARQWAGDARWYRCELLEITNARGDVARRTSSMRDGLGGAKPLALTCANEKLTKDREFVENLTFVTCSKPHDVELTGIFTAGEGPYPGDEKVYDTALRACFTIGAKYLGMTRSALDNTGGISWSAWGGGEEAWSAGNRSFWCFMGEYPARKLTGSIKNRKPGSFPH